MLERGRPLSLWGAWWDAFALLRPARVSETLCK
jgi:hypothetical protein